ncbi:DUF5347 domain-containing protein [Xenorhabdus nematophila]|uniref:Phage-related protein n=1 Tax=Xenorhabdus nematophila (strain ATCC 19061 / DSM 3370 / CCUG 14189 / LMG 1036 / NCIMB 9965 / AN6) TaxID=406817 RepID=D3VKP1_XENNA|nr:DUF5347 domain-containing protein [Xenorhabdus nematophila]CBJ91149.1 Phage-related protein [Xenorhabdus nematophila ATCC 19061]CEK23971.1 Phage-related protein [Xenorhabdus nematophila AN6/1]
MANTESCRAVVLTLDERIDGLNAAAELRHKVFSDDNSELAEFMEYMRDRTNNRVRNNERILHLIFHLAGFDKSRYDVKFNELTKNEQRALILAMNQFKAVASILPAKLVLSALMTH